MITFLGSPLYPWGYLPLLNHSRLYNFPKKILIRVGKLYPPDAWIPPHSRATETLTDVFRHLELQSFSISHQIFVTGYSLGDRDSMSRDTVDELAGARPPSSPSQMSTSLALK